MKTKRKFKENLLINPKFQISFISYFFSLAMVSFLLQVGTTFLYQQKIQQQLSDVGLGGESRVVIFISKQQSELLGLQILISLLTLAIMVYVGFKVSHKVAGPLYKLSQFLKNNNVKNVGYKELKFRKGDYFQEIPKEFNEFIESKKNAS